MNNNTNRDNYFESNGVQLTRGGQTRKAQMKPTDPCVSVGSGRVRAVGAGPAGNFFGFSGLLGSVAGGLIQPVGHRTRTEVVN
jgi:hypothetical protein